MKKVLKWVAIGAGIIGFWAVIISIIAEDKGGAPATVPGETVVLTVTPKPKSMSTGFEGNGTWVVGKDISTGYYTYDHGQESCTFTLYVPDWFNLASGEWQYKAANTLTASTPNVKAWIYVPYDGMKVTTLMCAKWKRTAEAYPFIESAAAAQHLQMPPPFTCVWTDTIMLMPNLGEARRTGIPPPLGHVVPECDRYWEQDWGSILGAIPFAPTPTLVSRIPTPSPTPTPSGPGTNFGDGTWRVGVDIVAGTYHTEGTDSCYWERVSGFSGTFAEIIANDNPRGPAVVTIPSSDVGFTSKRCGTWVAAETVKPAQPSAQMGDGTWRVG